MTRERHNHVIVDGKNLIKKIIIIKNVFIKSVNSQFVYRGRLEYYLYSGLITTFVIYGKRQTYHSNAVMSEVFDLPCHYTIISKFIDFTLHSLNYCRFQLDG